MSAGARLRAPLALAALLAALSACKTIPFPEPVVEGAYGTALKNATRRQVLYSSLETRAFVHIVYVTPALAEAQAERLSRLRGEPAAAAAERRERMRAEVAAPTFFAIVFTPLSEWNDWDAKTSVWRIALHTGAGEQLPVKIERHERPFGADLAAIYPYVDDFRVAYRIQFPPGPIPEAPRLVIAGSLGRMAFDWTE